MPYIAVPDGDAVAEGSVGTLTTFKAELESKDQP